MPEGGQDWGYSSDALGVLDMFHEADAVVFVEGKDDKLFWSALFDKCGFGRFFVDDAGGIPELQKIIQKVIDEDAKVIVACDRGYSLFTDTLPTHNRIVRTYGHSIENTMYCPQSIAQALQKLSRNLEDKSDTIEYWLSEFCESCKVLIVYDLANEKYGKGVEVMGEKCSRFLRSGSSYKLDQRKIEGLISRIRSHFMHQELAECENLVDQCPRELRQVVKGHFLTNGVINLLKSLVQKQGVGRPVIPLNTLYALTCDGCMRCTAYCREFNDTKHEVKKAYDSLRLL